MTTVLVLGTGLIGTSLGLALAQTREGGQRTFEVLLDDVDPVHLRAAVQRGAGRTWDHAERVDIVVAAGPPTAIPGQLHAVQKLKLAQTYTHVSSVQSQVQREVEALGCDMSCIVGGHPLAGRETSGPGSARADLFLGRPWALCPSAASSVGTREAVRALVEAVGAVPVELTAAEHDGAVAVLSHLPQVVASGLAGQLLTESGAGRSLRTELSGPGLVDTTRLAASGLEMWTQILAANSSFVAPAVRSLAAELQALSGALEELADAGQPREAAAVSRATAMVTAFLERGNRGRALVPVKRGVRDVGFAHLAVTVDDQPGRLAALLTDAGAAQVNVEDVHVDHVPGRATGVIELLVAVDAADGLARALQERGWQVRQETEPL